MDLYKSGRQLKHTAVIAGRRVVLLQPDAEDLNSVYIIEVERLPHSLGEIVVREVETNNAQTKIWFMDALYAIEYDGMNMVQFLFRTAGAITKCDYRQVLMVPYPGQQIPLSQVYDAMVQADSRLAGAYATWKANAPVDDQSTPAVPTQEVANAVHNQAVEDAENAKAIAKNLLFQAQILEADAKAKLEEAYKYDPSLRPVEAESAGFVDSETGKVYKTNAALKAAVSRRENSQA